jgi:hypothetical protein
MRQVINGYNADTTAATFAFLTGGNAYTLKHLYLIGDPNNPQSFWLTDYESPLWWPVWGNVAWQPATVECGTVTSKIGLDSPSLDITWSPQMTAYSASIATASVWQLAQTGYYDDWPVRVWTAYILPGGDLMTLGCSTLFGGVVGKTTTTRKSVVFSVDSFLYVTGQQVPTNVIELLNTVAAYTGATPPAGFSLIPQFNVLTGDSDTVIEGDCTTAGIGLHYQFGDNVFQHGYMVFNDGPGATLAGVWSAIQQNKGNTVGAVNANQFILYAPLPWPPEPFAAGSGDTFFVSAAAPENLGDAEYWGFPYVPAPQSSL